MSKQIERDPHDGEPYFCKLCGDDYATFLTCSDGECALESKDTAADRARRKRRISSDMAFYAEKTKD